MKHDEEDAPLDDREGLDRGGPAGRSVDGESGSAAAAEREAIGALEAELSAALAAGGEPRAPSPGLRERLRASFLSGRFEGDGSMSDGMGRVLGAWRAPRATATARDTIRSEFLSTGAPRTGSVARRLPGPLARRRLVVAGVVLAAAAAALLLVLIGGASNSRTWTIDRDLVAEVGADTLLREVLVDGRRSSSLALLEEALDRATTIEVGDAPVRLRRGEAFVVELAESARLVFVDDDLAAPPGSLVLSAEQGAVRVATGPAFRSDAPLIIWTPHVRTEVRGTIYGIDVSDRSTCVCCLEGEVHTEPRDPKQPGAIVSGDRTRLIVAGADPMESNLVSAHRPDLESLEGYWL